MRAQRRIVVPLSDGVKLRRRRVRRVLSAAAPDLAHLAAQVANCVPGVDPEAGLVYLAMLRDACDEALSAASR